MKATEHAQLARAQAGDMEAFADVFEAYRPVVFRVALRLVGEADAEDVVMETFLKAWKALPRFRGNSGLQTWLFRICNNCAYDVLRARGRRGRHEVCPRADANGETPEPVDVTAATPAEQAADRDLAAAVRAGLAALPPDHARVLLLRYADGLSYRETAAAVGVSVGTVMSRLFYARKKLQQQIRWLERNATYGA